MKISTLTAVLLVGVCFQTVQGQDEITSPLAQPNNQRNHLTGQLLQGYSDATTRVLGTRSRLLTSNSRSAPVRFLNFHHVKEDRKQSIREDAAIINHMISSELPLKNSRSALGVNYVQTYGQNEISYDDHGLTFVYHVPVVLMAGENTDAEPETSKPQTPWEKAKAELESPAVGSLPLAAGIPFLANSTHPPFNQDYVDRITKSIRTALNNSGNIRDLAEDDMITVMVYGRSRKPGMRSVKGWRIKWKNVKDGQTGLSAAMEEISYEEKQSGGGVTGFIQTQPAGRR